MEPAGIVRMIGSHHQNHPGVPASSNDGGGGFTGGGERFLAEDGTLSCPDCREDLPFMLKGRSADRYDFYVGVGKQCPIAGGPSGTQGSGEYSRPAASAIGDVGDAKVHPETVDRGQMQRPDAWPRAQETNFHSTTLHHFCQYYP